MKFSKMHHNGNDFMIVENINKQIKFNISLIKKLANRNTGIGFDQLSNYWLILKLIFVTILTFYHFFLGTCLNKFKRNENKFSSRFYRVFNEIPTLLLILIIFVVVFKPL